MSCIHRQTYKQPVGLLTTAGCGPRGRPPNKNITTTSGRPQGPHPAHVRTSRRLLHTLGVSNMSMSYIHRQTYKQPIGLPTTAGCGPRGRPPNKNTTATSGRIHKIIPVASGRSNKNITATSRRIHKIIPVASGRYSRRIRRCGRANLMSRRGTEISNS